MAELQLLKMEVLVLNELQKRNSGRHFCQIFDRAVFQDFQFVVMTLLGELLHDLRKVRCLLTN